MIFSKPVHDFSTFEKKANEPKRNSQSNILNFVNNVKLQWMSHYIKKSIKFQFRMQRFADLKENNIYFFGQSE